MRELHAKVREIFPFSLPQGLLEAENVEAQSMLNPHWLMNSIKRP
jgi:hypothetical protein